MHQVPGYKDNDFLDMANGRSNRYTGIAANSEMMKPFHKLTLSRINDRVYRVLADQDEHVGNLKFINGVWKFKAIGCNKNGDIMPGWGPLTDRHNTTFDTLDEALINAKLAPT